LTPSSLSAYNITVTGNMLTQNKLCAAALLAYMKRDRRRDDLCYTYNVRCLRFSNFFLLKVRVWDVALFRLVTDAPKDVVRSSSSRTA
jgi:hypothetical protein